MPGEDSSSSKQTQNKFLHNLKGKEVLVVFVDGKGVQGTLDAYDQYTLFLRREDGLEVAVFKHAVKYLHLIRKR